MKSYKVKLKNQDEDNYIGYLTRKVEISTSSKKIYNLVKIPPYMNERMGITSPINEVLINITLKEIIDINGTNCLRDAFIKNKVAAKLKKNSANIVFVRISRSDGTAFPELNNNIDKIAEFIVDLIYSHPMIDIITFPHMEPLKNEPSSNLTAFDTLIRNRLTELMGLENGTGKVGYFLPSYYNRDGIVNLMDDYMKNFGPEGIYICDVNGGTFIGIGYSILSQILRGITNESNTENYALYIYSQKPKRKAGGEVPSEDLLALLNGVSIVGPSHKRQPLPKNIVEKLKTQQFNPKILNRSDFLLYPYNIYPHASDLDDWISHNSINQKISNTSRKRLLDLYNSITTKDSITSIETEPRDTVNSLGRDDFKKELRYIRHRMGGNI